MPNGRINISGELESMWKEGKGLCAFSRHSRTVDESE
jgi:hypothetical protein